MAAYCQAERADMAGSTPAPAPQPAPAAAAAAEADLCGEEGHLRHLGSIVTIEEITKHPNADSLALARVKGWQVIINSERDCFKPGDRAVYCEIDSVVPEGILQGRAELEILRSRNFRIKTAKIRDEISQGILFTMDILKCAGLGPAEWDALPEGYDVTEQLGLQKYEPPPPGSIPPKVRTFPSFMPRTDEARVQNIPRMLPEWVGKRLYACEKVDGSSVTVYMKDGEYGVCSRNHKVEGGGVHWDTAESLSMQQRMREKGLDNVALQGEVLGPKIQGNKYKFTQFTIRWFSAFDIARGCYLQFDEAESLVTGLGLQWVPVIHRDFEVTAGLKAKDFVRMADGESKLRPGVPREGLVFRSAAGERHPGFGRISFKAISNKWLLKNKE
eukprot:TRINITY_DN39327_c0_g1_i1.p1 TRINITY_DN39327_c0_g1~~TRINITY_DN39327_c0_g1_i1.p1  ORF type:complete len:450 (+),score=166.44 TRINITY_DN39327_c0_g1_i1:190-1350(+)